MNRSLIGIALLGVVIIVSVVASLLDWSALRRAGPDRLEPVAISIFYGGEKSRLLANPTIERILTERHRITLSARKAGSIEMATTLDATGMDCLWPSNQVAVALAREAGKPVKGDQNIFNSPIVFYAWAPVADALAKAGVVSRGAENRLTADVAALGRLITERARWREDLGLDVYGPVKVFSTHPAKSNSGNIWSALLATVFNEGGTPTAADLPVLLPKITEYFEAMGHMESSSGDIFENFLKQGMGARPIIVGYENQLVEFLVENQGYADQIRDRIRVIYPEPTIFASHPLISLTAQCDRLADALSDPEVRAVAWAEHGFRTGLIGVENDPSAIAVAQLPAVVSQVAPMPDAAVMRSIIDAVR